MSEDKNSNANHKGGILILTVGAISLFSGFFAALNMSKKSDSKAFYQGIFRQKNQITESGSKLALRALGYGTLLCVGGISFTVLCSCYFMKINSLNEFNTAMRNVIPQSTKKPSEGRNDFESLRDLVNYIIDLDAKKNND